MSREQEAKHAAWCEGRGPALNEIKGQHATTYMFADGSAFCPPWLENMAVGISYYEPSANLTTRLHHRLNYWCKRLSLAEEAFEIVEARAYGRFDGRECKWQSWWGRRPEGEIAILKHLQKIVLAERAIYVEIQAEIDNLPQNVGREKEQAEHEQRLAEARAGQVQAEQERMVELAKIKI